MGSFPSIATGGYTEAFIIGVCPDDLVPEATEVYPGIEKASNFPSMSTRIPSTDSQFSTMESLPEIIQLPPSTYDGF